MTFQEIQDIQKRIKFDARSMAACLGIDYDQYRHYYYGHIKIPAGVARAAQEIENIEKEFDIKRDADYCQFLQEKFPFGVPNEARRDL
jgi:hypothetical protein